MDKHWIALQSIPAGGTSLRLTNQDIWQTPLEEFKLPVRITQPVTAEITILPQAEGVLFRGALRGQASMVCDRCSGDCLIDLDHSFTSFEPLPAEAAGKGTKFQPQQDEQAEEIDEAVIRLAEHGKGIEINPAALAWEEFSLALPVKPLCTKDCKGLCPLCGCNKNTENCSCDTRGHDPRLAALQGLVIPKK